MCTRDEVLCHLFKGFMKNYYVWKRFHCEEDKFIKVNNDNRSATLSIQGHALKGVNSISSPQICCNLCGEWRQKLLSKISNKMMRIVLVPRGVSLEILNIKIYLGQFTRTMIKSNQFRVKHETQN